MNESEQPAARPEAFAPTHWTLVLRARGASPAAQAALGELCEAYYRPVLAFIRRSGRDDDSARDLAQGFFARLLAGHALDNVDPSHGRFRCFLLGAVKHFLADQYDRARAAKRGGGQADVPLESGTHQDTTAEFQIPDPAGPPPDTAFDREWALTIVGRAMDLLAAEFSGDKAAQFETLKPWLAGQVDFMSQGDAACQLGISEGAVKVAIHRLRKRFRELVKSEISRTLPDPAQVQDELRYLLEVLSAP